MQDANQSDVLITFNIKHHMRKALAGPKPQARNVKRVGVAQRSGTGAALNMQICFFKRIQKTQSYARCFDPVIVKCLLDIQVGL